jgi:hypothetical protein
MQVLHIRFGFQDEMKKTLIFSFICRYSPKGLKSICTNRSGASLSLRGWQQES